MRIGSGFPLIPQRPEAVLAQLEVDDDAALFTGRHTDRKEEA